MPMMVVSKTTIVAPGTRADGICASPSSAAAFPYGGRLRLKASFDDSAFGPQARVITTALKKYGAINTDVGCCYVLRVEKGRPWNSADVGQIQSLTIQDFEVPTLPANQSWGGACANDGCQ